MTYHLAIDIGASGGRHLLGQVVDGRIEVSEVYRFSNAPVGDDELRWDIDALFEHVLFGMAECARRHQMPATIGIDTWGVDFVLLDDTGTPVSQAVCYRDRRTDGIPEVVDQLFSPAELYQRTGIQRQPFNTMYQLVAARQQAPEQLDAAASLAMLPDYLHFRLSGQLVTEYTNATTTGLVNATARTWDPDLIAALGLPERLFGPLVEPGTRLGQLRPEIAARVGFDAEVIAPATHDTASAFLAAPSAPGTVILSSGTWSLIGVETATPLLDEQARCANFTNEGGFGGTYRFLKNIVGLWLVQSLRREFVHTCFTSLANAARSCNTARARLDVTSPALRAPSSMSSAIRAECARLNQPIPASEAELGACVYDSLAHAYAAAIEELRVLTGADLVALQIVGGGSQDRYLNELTARACGLKTATGPIEATAIGNLGAQFIASGAFAGVSEFRAAVKASFPSQEVSYEPV